MEEIWKDIPKYEGHYQASNLGRIKSLQRKRKHPSGTGTTTVKERILKAAVSPMGYLTLRLSKDGKKKTLTVHKLVAMAFLNHTPCGHKMVVNHINFNKQDNRVCNLEIVTQRENANRKHLKSTSDFVGVYWAKGKNKWGSSIILNGKQKHLGYFKKEIEAHNAYQNKLKEINN